jgi:hypothetical protein
MNLKEGKVMRITKKRLMSIIAVSMVLVMAFGINVQAKKSPSTKKVIIRVVENSGGGGGGESAPPSSGPVYRAQEATNAITMPAGGAGAIGVNTANGQNVRLSADYSGVSGGGLATAVSPAPGKDSITDALTAYVNGVGGTKIGPFKIRFYRKGQAIWTGFGTLTQTFGIGNGYDGHTVTIFQIHQNRQISQTSTRVSGGRVSVSITEMGSFYLVVD